MAYDNTLRGAMFVNDDKRTEKHPDYKGSIETEDGQQYWCSAWIKEIQNGKNAGNKFLSLALTPKDNNAATGRQETQNKDSGAAAFLESNKAKIDAHRPSAPSEAPDPYGNIDFDDDIPF